MGGVVNLHRAGTSFVRCGRGKRRPLTRNVRDWSRACQCGVLSSALPVEPLPLADHRLCLLDTDGASQLSPSAPSAQPATAERIRSPDGAGRRPPHTSATPSVRRKLNVNPGELKRSLNVVDDFSFARV